MAYVLSAALIFIAAFLAAFAVFSFMKRKKSPIGLSLAWLLVSLVIYSGGYAGELLSRSISGMLMWNRLEYFGISFIPALWILFTARYVNARWITHRRVIAVLFFISLTTLLAVCTDPLFHLRYTSVWLRSDGPFPVLAFVRGPFYWSHTAYCFVSLAIGSVLLLRSMFSAPRFFRGQQVFMFAGAGLPWINYSLYLAGISIWGIDTIPFSMFLSAACFGFSIFGYRILDVIPVARGIVFETMSDGVIVLDTSGRIVDFNRAAASVFSELTTASFSEDMIRVLSRAKELCSHVSAQCEGEFQFSVGEGDSLRYYLCRITDILSRASTPSGKIIIFKDNTDSTLLVEKLQELATIDPLTRIFNRRHFIELTGKQISQLARSGRPLSIIILDIDFFKRINDIFGHLAGDEVLRSIAGIISGEIRDCDIVSRFGGEEFICLLPETVGTDAYLVAERMRQAIRQARISIPGTANVSLSASFGVYCVDAVTGRENIDTLIGRADIALYRAKESGRNRTVVYTRDMEPPG